MSGFVSAQSVTASDGEIGSASLHFMTSEGPVDNEEPTTPRASSQPAVHSLNAPDPWSDWHQDPWAASSAQQTVPGVWPPNNQGVFPGSTQHRTTPEAVRPEVGPSLLPSSESQALTRMFGSVLEQATVSSGEYMSPYIQDHQQWLQSQLLGRNSQPSSLPHVVENETMNQLGQPIDFGNPVQATAGLFSQVFALRQPVNSQQVQPTSEVLEVPIETEDHQGASTPPVVYEGDDSECSICQVAFAERDKVVRLTCRHVFHQECFDEYISRTDTAPSCPNCRGSPNVIALFRYIMPVPTPEASRVQTPVSSVFHTPSSFPWWPVPDHQGTRRGQKAQVYHTTTHRTEDGRLGLLVDPGSFGNLVGDQWITAAAREASIAGYQTNHRGMPSPLEVGGVGSGTQQCRQQVILPAALRSADGSMTQATYTAPVIPSSACQHFGTEVIEVASSRVRSH